MDESKHEIHSQVDAITAGTASVVNLTAGQCVTGNFWFSATKAWIYHNSLAITSLLAVLIVDQGFGYYKPLENP